MAVDLYFPAHSHRPLPPRRTEEGGEWEWGRTNVANSAEKRGYSGVTPKATKNLATML